MNLRRWAKATGWLALAGGLVVVGCNAWVVISTRDRLFEDLAQVPARDVALVLGTSSTVQGRSNLHFLHRMDAAAGLYQAGKVKRLLVSGDNSHRDYDEPTDMKDALVARGVPATAIVLDHAGFRTLDSVIRARKVFGLTSLTLVTEQYHCGRALFACRYHGIDAVAFAAPNVGFENSPRSRMREYLARVLAVADLYVFHRGPKFLGPPVEVVMNAR